MKDINLRQFDDIKLSDKVVVSDPCYERGTWCMGIIENVKKGKWRTFVEYYDDGKWGTRVKNLIVSHNRATPTRIRRAMDFEVGVDSGCAGVFCDSIYPMRENENWRDKVSDVTMEGYNDLYTYYNHLKVVEGFKNLTVEDLETYNEKAFKELGVYSTSAYIYAKHRHSGIIEEQITKEGFVAETLNKIRDNIVGYESMAKTGNSFEKTVGETLAKEAKDLVRYIETGTLPKKPYYPQAGVVDGRGFVSSSGYGDGGYICYVKRNRQGQVVGIRINYI